MILSIAVRMKDIESQGKDYNWARPIRACFRCQQASPWWGHGYVLRYFNVCSVGLWLKRWRCRFCGLIVTMRPEGFWRRFHESIQTIFESLLFRVTHQTWPSWTTRQRAGHWLVKFVNHAKLHGLIKKTMLATISFYQQKNLVIF